ncbi:MAG: sigma-70 family RNA polymerase sigma factor [Planctomycetota bacterium]
MTLLIDPHSPLAQAQQTQRVRTRPASKPLSDADQAQLRELLDDERYDFMDADEFHQDDDAAYQELFTDAEEVPKPETSWYHPVMDSYKKATEAVGRSNKATVVLTAAQERVIFKQFNYCRYRACRLREQLRQEAELDADLAREMLKWFRRGEFIRDQIANTNLALVLAMAKRTRMSEVDFADLISEGNMALLRAVDKFDATRGFKFSTYACRAILKAFSRQGIKLSKHRAMFPTDFDPKLERSNFVQSRREEHEEDCVDEVSRIFNDNIAELSDIEKAVIDHRFGLSEEKKLDDASPLTLEQVGKLIGVTKERVRQIQNKALDKLRLKLEDDFLK